MHYPFRAVSSAVRKFHYSFILILLALIPFSSLHSQWLTGYNHRKAITILESQIPGSVSLVNFPVLIDITDNDLRICPGGFMERNEGWDIRFTDVSGNQLSHDIEGYNPSTGRLTVWVRVPALSATANTVLYLYFGNPSVTASSSSRDTWDPIYRGVWHLGNISDASLYSHPSTNINTTSTQGKILDGRDFVRSNQQYISIPYDNDLDFGESITVSAWINVDNNGYDQKVFSNQNGKSSGGGYKLGMYTDRRVEFEIRTNGNTAILNRGVSGGTIISPNQWYYVTGVYSNSGDFICTYVNGDLDRTFNTEATAGLTGSGNPAIGRETTDDKYFFDGKIDELRVQRTVRDANWIKTEFNNQSSPSTFFSAAPTESFITAICKNTTLNLDAYGTALLTIPMIDNGSSSGCRITKTLSRTTFGCSDLGSNNVTLTVNSSFGSDNCIATVTVADALPPVVSVCPSHITVNNSS